MVDEPTAFAAALATFVLGLVVLLYGVSLNAGQALNAEMLAGGVVLVVAVAIHTAGVMSLEGGEGH